MLPNRKILVTGGAGFIGASIVRDLARRGAEVVVLDSGFSAGFANLDGVDVRVVRADIRDRETVRSTVDDCTAIVHLAARASVPESIADPLEDAAVNVTGTLGLLDAARVAGVRRFVFASSNAVIGGHPPPANEGLVAFPVSPYGAAKAAIEAYLLAYGQAYGLEGVALRFANAYGPWSGHKNSVVAAFIKAYLAGGPLVVRGNGEQTRDFIHVADVSAIVAACLDAPSELVASQVFQVGTGRETSLLELARQLFEAGGAEVPIRYEAASPGDVPRNVSDISRAAQVLGFAPRMGLTEGLRQTIEWFRDSWRH